MFYLKSRIAVQYGVMCIVIVIHKKMIENVSEMTKIKMGLV